MYVLFSQLTGRDVFQGFAFCLSIIYAYILAWMHLHRTSLGRNSSHGYHYVIKKSIKVTRYSVLGSIPPEFEHKLRRHKQIFGKMATTVVLDKNDICYNQSSIAIGGKKSGERFW